MERTFRCRLRRHVWWLSACVALAWGGCAAPGQTGENGSARAELHACRLTGGAAAECGTVEVFEDRAARRGRRVALKVAVVRAHDRSAAPDPLFVLVGGPGQAATRVGPALLPALDRIRRHRDIVLVDQRGTGSSRPLACEGPTDARSELEDAFRSDIPVDRLRACLARYDADPRLYTTQIAVDDLDEVRERLGYAQISIWGGSYGTRAALVYAQRHRERLRAVILDGAVPASMRLPLFVAEDSQRALTLAFADCEKQPSCRRAFPSLARTLDELLLGLERAPARVELAHPRTGERFPVTVERAAVTSILTSALYAPETAALIPTVIERAARGDFGPLGALALMGADPDQALSLGMFLSVVCAEDLPFVSPDEQLRREQGTFLRDGFSRKLRAACEIWPRGAAEDPAMSEVQSDVPALILSGEFDPVTPPRWGETMARAFSRSRHLVARGVGHGTVVRGCVPELMADFIEAGNANALDADCLQDLSRPPFFVSFAGPPP